MAATDVCGAGDEWERTFDAVPDLVAIIGRDYHIKRINKAMADRLGVSKEEAVGKACYDLVHGGTEPHASCPFRQLIESGKCCMTPLFEKSLESCFVVTVVPLPAGDGSLAASVHVMRDITEKKRMEEWLLEDVERLALAVEGSNDVMWDWDLLNKRINMNYRYYDMIECSVEEPASDPAFFTKWIHPDDLPEVEKRLKDLMDGGTGTLSMQYRLLTRSGKTKYVMARGKAVRHDDEGRPVKLAGFITDMTEMKKLGDEVNRMRRLESIAILTGGLAHDFNNVLNVISGNLSYVKSLPGCDAMILDSLKDAEDACERAAGLTRKLREFTRESRPAKEPVNIREVIDEVTAALSVDPDIRCSLSVADDLFPVEADPKQIRQVFTCILSNAREAMTGDGAIEIDIRNVVIGRRTDKSPGPGNYLLVSIRDHGKGIPEEDLDWVFDPYFSTKTTYNQKGVGLGLAMCHSIIKRHNGHIGIESEPGQGTTVSVYLPAAG